MTVLRYSLLFLLFVLSTEAVSFAASLGVTLPESHLYSKGKIRCGYINGKWEAGQLKLSVFTSHAAKIADLKKKLKKAKPTSRASLNRQIAALKLARTTQNKKVCSKLAAPSPTPTPTSTPAQPAFSSLSKIPAATNLLRASSQQGALAVSGQPPALVEIPAMDVKTLYWQPGLIESIIGRSAGVNQCRDFWFGDVDGESGGMNACNMTGQMGYTFSPIMLAGVSLCYLKSLPSAQLISSGSVQVVSGNLPPNPQHLFDPGETPHLLRLQISGPRPALLYVRVYSRDQNTENGYQYHADIWQCGGESNEAVLRHSIVVNNEHQYQYGFYSHEGNFSSGGHQFTVEAGLSLDNDGTPGFDLSKDRHAVAEHRTADGSFGFRQDIRITPENLLKIKSRWLFNYGWRSDYSVSRFTGTGIRDVRLLEGAIKAQDHNNGEPQYDSLNGMEYRDTSYAAAPTGALVQEASTADFATDAFFGSEPSVQIDTSAYPCNLQPHLTLAVHGENADVAALFSACDQFTIWDTNFCAEDQELSAARQQWESYCPAVIAAE